jgi:hypothetical protein
VSLFRASEIFCQSFLSTESTFFSLSFHHFVSTFMSFSVLFVNSFHFANSATHEIASQTTEASSMTTVIVIGILGALAVLSSLLLVVFVWRSRENRYASISDPGGTELAREAANSFWIPDEEIKDSVFQNPETMITVLQHMTDVFFDEAQEGQWNAF